MVEAEEIALDPEPEIEAAQKDDSQEDLVAPAAEDVDP